MKSISQFIMEQMNSPSINLITIDNIDSFKTNSGKLIADVVINPDNYVYHLRKVDKNSTKYVLDPNVWVEYKSLDSKTKKDIETSDEISISPDNKSRSEITHPAFITIYGNGGLHVLFMLPKKSINNPDKGYKVKDLKKIEMVIPAIVGTGYVDGQDEMKISEMIKNKLVPSKNGKDIYLEIDMKGKLLNYKDFKQKSIEFKTVDNSQYVFDFGDFKITGSGYTPLFLYNEYGDYMTTNNENGKLVNFLKPTDRVLTQFIDSLHEKTLK